MKTGAEVVRDELELFLARARTADVPVARFVEREVRAYLECGLLPTLFIATKARLSAEDALARRDDTRRDGKA